MSEIALSNMSINKIHINNSTKMSLNDRFTVMQAAGPKIPARKLNRRPLNRASQSGQTIHRASLANRTFLDQLEKKHKILAAMKIKRRSLKASIPTRRRNQNRIALKKVVRMGANGKLSRANSLSQIATLKSDYVKPAVKRSNSTSNLASRLGTRRTAGTPEPRRKLNRNNLIRSNSKQNLSRSNSAGSIRRSNSRQSLRRSRSNSKINTNRIDNRIPGNRNIRPVRNLGRRMPRRSLNNIRRGQGRLALGRIYKRRNSTGSANAVNNSVRQGRISRPRGRGNSAMRRGRSRSRSNIRGSSRQMGRGESARGNRGSVRGRGRGGGVRGRGRGRSRRRGIGRPSAQKPDIRKEDLDKELDQYMANTKISMDKDDVLMNSSI